MTFNPLYSIFKNSNLTIKLHFTYFLSIFNNQFFKTQQCGPPLRQKTGGQVRGGK
jgi:hypothetical protein